MCETNTIRISMRCGSASEHTAASRGFPESISEQALGLPSKTSTIGLAV